MAKNGRIENAAGVRSSVDYFGVLLVDSTTGQVCIVSLTNDIDPSPDQQGYVFKYFTASNRNLCSINEELYYAT
jgi:hypothetical protein